MNRTRFSVALIAPLAMFASGCALGPDFKSPPVPGGERAALTLEPLPAETASAPVPGGEAQRFLASTPVAARWWEQYGSAELNALVNEALRGSPSVASAQAAMRAAQANARARYSDLFPDADLAFTGNRQKIDFGSFGQPGGGSLIYNLFNASVNVSYGLDLWGGTRRGVEAEKALAEAKAHELMAAYQTLIANVVTSAITVAENDLLVEGAEILVRDQTERVELARKQQAIGAITRAEVAVIEGQLASEQVELATYQRAAHAARTQLAVYLGRTPGNAAAVRLKLMDLKLPTDIPVSLPSDLLRQRPDLRAAEAGLHAASARIGVAAANQLPQIALSANLGTQATQLGDLFGNNIWSLGTAVTQPLFRAGELSALKRAAIADYEQTEADYRLTVLNAFREVADSLHALQANAALLAAYASAAQSAEVVYTAAERQVEIGAGTRTEKARLHAELTRTRAGYFVTVASRLRDTAALHLALGGDWDTEVVASLASPPPAIAASGDGASETPLTAAN